MHVIKSEFRPTSGLKKSSADSSGLRGCYVQVLSSAVSALPQPREENLREVTNAIETSRVNEEY